MRLQTSKAYRSSGKHLDCNSCMVTSSEAILPIYIWRPLHETSSEYAVVRQKVHTAENFAPPNFVLCRRNTQSRVEVKSPQKSSLVASIPQKANV